VIRALGKTITLKLGQPLTKHDFLLSLSDVLLDIVENDLYGPQAEPSAKLGCSLAHDFINLGTIAGQLLWLVDTAPVRTGTPDSLSISLYAESYLMHLRSACDVIATIIHTFCIENKKKGQVQNESFNDLIDWIEKNPSRAPDDLKFLVQHKDDWFSKMRSIRDKLVHHRFDINIFTNEIAPSFSTMSTGEIHLHLLRKPGEFLDPPLTLTPLMPFLKHATCGLLNLADKTAEVIIARTKHVPSKKHVINGVYIPALHHMLSYEEPSKEEIPEDEKRRRKIKARYLLEAGNYLRAVNLGHPDSFWLQCAVLIEELFGEPPYHSSIPKHPKYRDGEALIGWQIHFKKMECEYVVVFQDSVHLEKPDELERAKQVLHTFKQEGGLAGIVLVSNTTSLSKKIPAAQVFDGLVIEADATQAADRAYAALMRMQ
jgi:hypothetical protein